MNEFKVILHEEKDKHFLTIIKAFDSSSITTHNIKENNYHVSTILSIEEVKSFTSVKEVNYINSWAQRNGYGNGHGNDWGNSSQLLQDELVKKWAPNFG